MYCMLTYRNTKNLKVMGYLDSNYVGCLDSRKSIFIYVFIFLLVKLCIGKV